VERWHQVQRLDPHWAAEAVQAATGVELTVEEACLGGQVGAAYVRHPDGHRSVLTWQPGQRLNTMRSRQLATADALHSRGYPVPIVELAVEVPTPGHGQAIVLVQELLPGKPVERLDANLLNQAVALNDSQADALADRPDIPAVRLYLLEDGPGFCLHEPLRRHSRRAAALEKWVRDVGHSVPTDVLAGDDAVHTDFQPTNLLTHNGRITGVVDWDGAGRGDRRLDLVTLRFGVWPQLADTEVVRRLDDLIAAIPTDVLRPSWAHMSLRMVDWAIRHFPPGHAERWLDLAEQRAH
jgi:aminoglycoside phosphotransferase (APT) family kinase protein